MSRLSRFRSRLSKATVIAAKALNSADYSNAPQARYEEASSIPRVATSLPFTPETIWNTENAGGAAALNDTDPFSFRCPSVPPSSGTNNQAPSTFPFAMLNVSEDDDETMDMPIGTRSRSRGCCMTSTTARLIPLAWTPKMILVSCPLGTSLMHLPNDPSSPLPPSRTVIPALNTQLRLPPRQTSTPSSPTTSVITTTVSTTTMTMSRICVRLLASSCPSQRESRGRIRSISQMGMMKG